MCLGIAGQIIEFLLESRELARANVFGAERVVNVGLVENEGLEPGDWVLIHVGFAIAKMDESEAKASMDFLREWPKPSPMKWRQHGTEKITKTNPKTKNKA